MSTRLYLMLLILSSLLSGCFGSPVNTQDGDLGDDDMNDGDSGPPDGDTDPPEIDDPSLGRVTLHESEVTLSVDAGSCTLHVPVTLDGDAPGIRASLTVGLATLAGGAATGGEGRWLVQLNPGRQTIGAVYPGVCPTDPAAAFDKLLNYRLAWEGGSIIGALSWYRVLPKLKTQVLGSASLLEGDGSLYRVLATDPGTGAPVAGVDVTLRLMHGEDELDRVAVATDQNGMAEARLAVPLDVSGTARVEAGIASEAHGSQTAAADVSIFRESRVLLTADKPFYQPGQTIHLRGLALKVPAQTPLAGREVVFEIMDPKGTKVFKQAGRTTGYGVAAVDFTLSKLVNLGHYTVRAVINDGLRDVITEKTITVENYALPKFRVRFSADRGFYQPGQRLAATVSSEYFYGKPVAGGSVHVAASAFDVEMRQFAAVDGTLDEAGAWSFELNLPDYFVGSELEQGKARVMLAITVTDQASHEQTINRSLPIVPEPVWITLVPEAGRLLPGLSQRFYLVLADPTGRPLAGSARVTAGDLAQDVAVGRTGLAIFELAPPAGVASFTVRATVDGASVTRTVPLSSEQAAEFVMLRLSSAIYQVGDTMLAEVITASRPDLPSPPMLPDRAYLDVIQNGQTKAMTTVELESGLGTALIDVDEGLAGPVELLAYYLTRDGNIVRDARVVFVHQNESLAVGMTSDRPQYRPRENAQITLSVADPGGAGAQAALGVTIVDEAVFALQEFQPGLERTYFQIEQAVMNASYEIHGFSPGELYQPDPEDEEEAAGRDGKAQAYFAANGEAAAFGLALDTYGPTFDNFKAVCSTAVRTIVKAAVEDVTGNQDCGYWDEQERDRVNGLFAEAFQADPWGNPMTFRTEMDWCWGRVVVGSAGPDERFGSNDDIEVVESVQCCRDEWNEDGTGGEPGVDGDMAFDGDAGYVDGDAEAADGDGPAPAIQLRSWFPETLLSLPQLVTGPDGTATIDVEMPDSITTWRLTALANTEDGRLGSMTGGILVFQDFFVDIDFPAFLTQNDEVAVPVGVYNYLPVEQTVTITAQAEPWFEATAGLSRDVVVGAGQVTAIFFPVKVRKIGRHTLTVTAEGSTLSDAIRREVEVRPDGIEQTADASDVLTKPVSSVLTIPGEAIPDSEKMFVKIYPGVIAQAIEGLDSILRMPSGCFEQTSSSTYPNVLVLQYLIETGALNPEVELKARDYITQGYQALLTFEVDGGGFEWFGNSPAHTVLTCYGLMEFVDMAQVHPVDPDLIARTAAWLAAQQKGDGSLEPTTGGIAEGAINNYEGSLLRTTAYAVWALARAQKEASAMGRGADWLLAHTSEADDTYTKAMVAMALVAAGRAGAPALERLVQTIIDDKKEDGEGGIYWQQTLATETYSQGDNATLETTALVGLLLLERGSSFDLVSGIMQWLARQKDSFGNWSTTQGTVLALRFLIGTLSHMTAETDATITVSANGSAPVTIRVTPSTSDVMRLVDLSGHLVRGDNAIEIGFAGTGQLMYQAVASWFVPGAGSQGPSGPLVIDVVYDTTEIAINDTVGVTATIRNVSAASATMVMASIGIPPGFDLVTDRLAAAVGPVLQKFEATPRQLILYLYEVPAGQSVAFSWDLLAKWPMHGSTGESSVWPYYNPEQTTHEAAQTVEVSE